MKALLKNKNWRITAGRQIPSENELIKTFKIRNTTARKTLLEIESKGWARHIKGKETYVLNRTEDHHLLRTLGSIYATRRGFHDSLIAEGFMPKNMVNGLKINEFQSIAAIHRLTRWVNSSTQRGGRQPPPIKD